MCSSDLQACQAIPGVAITTDIIAGFPGETETEFHETLDFVRSMGFAGGHVFSYSARPGTQAYRMDDRIDGATVKARSAQLRAVLAESSSAWQRQFIGTDMPVLWEANATQTSAGWQIEGLTDNYIRVTAIAPTPRWNQVDDVLLVGESDNGLLGNLTNTV